jgi:hypothetical protein
MKLVIFWGVLCSVGSGTLENQKQESHKLHWHASSEMCWHRRSYVPTHYIHSCTGYGTNNSFILHYISGIKYDTHSGIIINSYLKM